MKCAALSRIKNEWNDLYGHSFVRLICSVFLFLVPRSHFFSVNNFNLPAFLLFLSSLFLVTTSSQASQILNTATLLVDGVSFQASVAVTVSAHAKIRFLRADPESTLGSPPLPIHPPLCHGNELSLPTQYLPTNQFPLIDQGKKLYLDDATVYTAGEIVFIEVVDKTRNTDPNSHETIDIKLQVDNDLDTEYLTLIENNKDSGVFIGYIHSTTLNTNDASCELTVRNQSILQAIYLDTSGQQQVSAAATLIDPFGKTFNSVSGQAVNGITLTLINANTGLPAQVFSPNQSTSYPATITTGTSVTDAAGVQYFFTDGGYRFPFVAAGQYQIRIDQIPAGYRSPSIRTDAEIQTIPNAPFELKVGSRGEVFNLVNGPILEIDIPLDPMTTGLFLTKKASTNQASIGDFIQYNLTLENPNIIDSTNLLLFDTLPVGFKYQSGSSNVDGIKIPDPIIQTNGRQLTFNLGLLTAGQQIKLQYAVAVTANSPLGKQTNQAHAVNAINETSNIAKADVLITEDLVRSIGHVMGQMILGDCHETKGRMGISGIRLLMEDGRQVESDKDGLYHFEAISAGSHLIAIDPESVPADIDIVNCSTNSWNNGDPHNRLIDIQGGTLWRSDFYFKPRKSIKGQLQLALHSHKTNERIQHTLSLSAESVQFNKSTLSLSLGKAHHYVENSARLNGKPLDAPKNIFGRLMFTLPVIHQYDWKTTLTWETQTTLDAVNMKAQLYYDTATQKKQKFPPLTTRIQDTTSQTTTAHHDIEITLSTSTHAKAQAAKKIDNTLGVLSIQDGDDIATAIAAVRIRLPSTLKPTLSIDGNIISSKRIGFTLPDKKIGNTLYSYIGVDLGHEGKHQMTLQGLDSFGIARYEQTISYQRTGEIHQLILMDQGQNVADGKTPVTLKIRMLDKRGREIHAETWLELKTGSLKPLTFTGSDQQRQNSPSQYPKVQVDRHGIIRFSPVLHSGRYQAELVYNSANLMVTTQVKPHFRKEWILVGIAETTLGQHTIKDNIKATDQTDGFYNKGKLAFYAKGKVLGKWLLTLAYDSQNKLQKNQQQAMFQHINPSHYYQLYGDSSQQLFDASSREKLYVRIESDQLNAVYGDINTDLNITELAKYSRSVTGFKTQYNGNRYSFNGFISDTDQAFVRDEFTGDGTSGLYQLSKQNLRVNSEKIRIETRDRFHSENILETQQLTVTNDYTIDPTSGTLHFRQPIFSHDRDFNPIYIVVEYEVIDPNQTGLIAGGRLAIHSDDRTLEAGITRVQEAIQGAPARLTGLDIDWKPNETLHLHAEIASTQQTTQQTSVSGTAWVLTTEYKEDDFQLEAAIREKTSGFGLGQLTPTGRGTRKLHAKGRYRINENIHFNGEISRDYNLDSGGISDQTIANIQQISDEYSLQMGVKFGVDDIPNQTKQSSTLLTMGGSYNLPNGKGKLKISADKALSSANANALPNRLLVGADYTLFTQVNLFVEEEFSWSKDQNTRSTRMGIMSSPWKNAQVRTGLVDKQSEEGNRSLATFGIQQRFQILPQLEFSLGFERSQTLRTPGNSPLQPSDPLSYGTQLNDFTAISPSLVWKTEQWSAHLRVDKLWGKQKSKLNLMTGFYRQHRVGVAFAGDWQHHESRDDSGLHTTQGEFDVSLAWHKPESRWMALSRTKLKYAMSDSLLDDKKSYKLIHNINLNYQPNHKSQLALQYGLKYSFAEFEQDDYLGLTQLAGFEYRRDLGKRWDVGLHSSILATNNTLQYSTGASLGFSPLDNVWLSAGYNFNGFNDDDLAEGGYLAKGPFIKLRVALDKKLSRKVLAWWE